MESHGTHTHDTSNKSSVFDVSNGRFQLNLSTVVLILGFAFTWYDGRVQDQRRIAVDQTRAEYMLEALTEVKRSQSLQQYDINTIKMALAESGIRVKKGDQ